MKASILASAVLVLVVPACRDGAAPVDARSEFRLRAPHGASVRVGDATIIHAEQRDGTGRVVGARNVTWSVSDATVFELTPGGTSTAVFRALRQGTATVTALSEGANASLRLNAVLAILPPGDPGDTTVARLELAPARTVSEIRGRAGGHVFFWNAEGRRVMSSDGLAFAVEDTTVATIANVVGPSVSLQPRRVGTTTLTVTRGSLTATSTVDIRPIP